LSTPKRKTWRAAAAAAAVGTPTLAKQSAPDVPAPTKQVAPWPLIDRYPLVLGANLTHAYISAAMRSATQGYRQQWVDVLDELLEREPFGFACLSQRILTTAGARKHVKAAKTKEGTPDADLAEKARSLVEAQLESIPNLTQHCATLLWAIYYGITALEKMWARVNRPDASWWITGLHFVHSRRLAYPDQSAWRLHIWDQGVVSINEVAKYPSEQLFGLAVDDYPHKFIVHIPSLRGDYATREGLGRELAFYFSLKTIAMRGAGQNVERFAKPWAWATYNTGTEATDGKPRDASVEDIAAGDAAVKAMGVGSLAGVSLPDSITLNMKTPDSLGAIGHKDLAALCDEAISACIRGNTGTSKVGRNGSRASMEVAERDEQSVNRYDAVALSNTLTEYIARSVIELNMPEAMHLVPTIEVAVEEEPDPDHIMAVVQKAVMAGIPVDADAVAVMAKLPVIPNDTKGPDGKPIPRRCVPLKPMDLGATEGVSDADAEQGKRPEDEPADDAAPAEGDDEQAAD
jgi:phage gp29-like protein